MATGWAHARHDGIVDAVGDLHLLCAARIAALTDAFRSIPDELAPCARARVVSVREQIYYGWELPLARAVGHRLLHGKYEIDGWWSIGAADLVRNDRVIRGGRQLEREHVNPVAEVVNDLLAVHREPYEVAALLEEQLVTCTVLSEEHRRLRPGAGWQRYRDAGIEWQRGLGD